MTVIQNSAQIFHNVLDAASQHKDVVLAGGETKPVPAKVGFMSRLVNWLSGGESTRKVHRDTRKAFLASIQNAFGAQVAQMCVKELKFQPASKKPLSSREIHDVAKLVASDKALAATQKELGSAVRASDKNDALFQPLRVSLGKDRHPSNQDLDRFRAVANAWAERKDQTHDHVSELKQQMENIRNLRKGH